MKNIRFIIGGFMSLLSCIFGFIHLFQGIPNDTERITALLWLIFALI